MKKVSIRGWKESGGLKPHSEHPRHLGRFREELLEREVDDTEDGVLLPQGGVSNWDSDAVVRVSKGTSAKRRAQRRTDNSDDRVFEVSDELLRSSLEERHGRVLLDSRLVDHVVVDDNLAVGARQVSGLLRRLVRVLPSNALSLLS